MCRRKEFGDRTVAVAVSNAPPEGGTSNRAVELLLIGTIAAVILWGMAYAEWYGLLERTSADEPPRNLRAMRGAYVESTSLRWFGLLVGYGALIPNTWRRCAAVVSVLAASPLVLFAVLSLWVRPLETEVALNALSGLVLWIGVAAAIVVFTSYRIEVLRPGVRWSWRSSGTCTWGHQIWSTASSRPRSLQASRLGASPLTAAPDRASTRGANERKGSAHASETTRPRPRSRPRQDGSPRRGSSLFDFTLSSSLASCRRSSAGPASKAAVANRLPCLNGVTLAC